MIKTNRGTMNLDSMRTANAAREAEEQREELLKKSAMVLIRDHLQVIHSFYLPFDLRLL